MTDEATPQETGGTVWDAPNQQTVRPDQSGPWMEGTGGSGPEGSTDPQQAGQGDTAASAAPEQPSSDLDAMTKDQLLEHAQQLGITPANASMTKDELRAAIDAHQGQG